MYRSILVGLDGSPCSDHAGDASLALAKSMGSRVVACHVYAAEMHRARFSEMEIGLPQRYQKPEKLEHLRDTHEDIISGGMKTISDAFLAPFIEKASAMGVVIEPKTPEGRNYVQFLNVRRETDSGLLVVGAEGLGKVPESSLGSFAERSLLLGDNNDVLIMRRQWNLKNHPVVVGVDGSEASFSALRRAVDVAGRFGSTVKAVAVYDPFFHTGVFSSISTALTKEQANRFNFAAQERLHDEIIDDGLRALYEKRVDAGIAALGANDVKVEKVVLTGKVFTQISHYASTVNAGLVVVGKFGIHREGPSLIGSTTHALSRTCPTNLLIVGEASQPTSEQARQGTGSLTEAPISIREEAKSPFADAAGEAEMVELKKTKRLAPSFHEHIARSRLVGSVVEAGSRFMVFEIVRTEPGGKVVITERTRLEFV